MSLDYEARLRLRRAFGVVAPAVLAVGALLFYRGAGPPPPATARWAATSPAPPTQAADPAPQGTAGGSAPRPEGPGVTRPGIRLTATPAVDGTLEVSELVWLPAPAASVRLGAPEVSRAGGVFAGARPVALAVQVTADGKPVDLHTAAVAGAPGTISLPTPARRLELRYILSGATVRSLPSASGRALAALAPMTRPEDPTLPVAIAAGGPAVINITCPLLPVEDQVCGTGPAGALRVGKPLPARDALVLLQINLPRP